VCAVSACEEGLLVLLFLSKSRFGRLIVTQKERVCAYLGFYAGRTGYVDGIKYKIYCF